MKVVFLSNVPDGSTFKLGSHHLSRELSLLGDEVVHVSTPVSDVEVIVGREIRSRRRPWRTTRLDPKVRELQSRVRAKDGNGVLQVIPRVRLPLGWFAQGRGLARALRRHGAADADVFVLDQLLFASALPFLRGAIVYRPTDQALGRRNKMLEARVLDQSSAFIACSEHVRQSVHPRARHLPDTVIENGVDERFFSVAHSGKRAGAIYVGAVDHRFDWDAVVAVAKASPTEPIDIYGPVTRKPGRSLPSNVIVRGAVDYESVPRLMAAAKVGLLPLNGSIANGGRSPMKYYEYLASGLRVVAADSPSLRSRGDVPGVALYVSNDEAGAVSRAFLSMEQPNHAGIDYARRFSWRRRGSMLREFLISALNKHDGPAATRAEQLPASSMQVEIEMRGKGD